MTWYWLIEIIGTFSIEISQNKTSDNNRFDTFSLRFMNDKNEKNVLSQFFMATITRLIKVSFFFYLTNDNFDLKFPNEIENNGNFPFAIAL